jgi:hypothetical protein
MNLKKWSFRLRQTSRIKPQRLFGVVLLLALFLPFIGAYTWLHQQRKGIRKEAKHRIIAGIDRKELTYLTFSTEEAEVLLNWKHDKEFEYNGEMYDIVHRNEGKDSVSYWCWWDKAETRLNKQLKTLVADIMGHHPEDRKTRGRLTAFFKTPWYQVTNEWSANLYIESQYVFGFTTQLYTPPVREIVLPPPQIV